MISFLKHNALSFFLKKKKFFQGLENVFILQVVLLAKSLTAKRNCFYHTTEIHLPTDKMHFSLIVF